MADADVQLPAAPPQVNVNVQDREQSKVPLFHADPAQDSFQAEYWIQRLQRLQTAFGWTNEQTIVNAINALRGDALHFITFLEKAFRNQGATTTNWPLFKQEFLIAFGKRARDTSSIANLAIQQRTNESVQKFAHRVAVTTDEFFAAMDPPDAVNYNAPAFANNAVWAARVADPVNAQIIQYATSETAAAIAACLNKTIFLNGLNAAIIAQVKNSAPPTFVDAYKNAMQVERNRQGPIGHTIALEKAGTKANTAQAVNAVRRGGTRGRGGRTSSSRPDYSASATGGAPNRNNAECWYCRKRGHVQNDCRKRINRGAGAVSKPRSVAELSTDNMLFQDGSDDEHHQDDDEDETDDYLNNALSENQSVDLINFAALHLN